ncbi:hypothetical protein Bca4012_044171 [Brassica carinata]|uniref:Uncharacterized protein n=1 Tax=Brassica carinata TaxID=52824 RepID=A0A8X7QS87_BRACI|nr:hypothetical protein Bca52824_058290 [Brassica carinata]
MASREGKRRTHQHHENLVPVAALLSRETRAAKMEKPVMDMSPSLYQTEWWEYVMEHSKEITSVTFRARPKKKLKCKKLKKRKP